MGHNPFLLVLRVRKPSKVCQQGHLEKLGTNVANGICGRLRGSFSEHSSPCSLSRYFISGLIKMWKACLSNLCICGWGAGNGQRSTRDLKEWGRWER